MTMTPYTGAEMETAELTNVAQPEIKETARYHDTLRMMRDVAGDLADALVRAHADPRMSSDPPGQRGRHQEDVDRLVRVLACGAWHLRTRTKWRLHYHNEHDPCECPACEMMP